MEIYSSCLCYNHTYVETVARLQEFVKQSYVVSDEMSKNLRHVSSKEGNYSGMC